MLEKEESLDILLHNLGQGEIFIPLCLSSSRSGPQEVLSNNSRVHALLPVALGKEVKLNLMSGF